MTGYSFTTPVWDGGAWVTPVVAEVVAAPKANGPEDQPCEAPAQWDKINWRVQGGQGRRAAERGFQGGPGEGRAPGRNPPQAEPPGQAEPAWLREAGGPPAPWRRTP